MASKAVVQDINDEGFTPPQFGMKPTDASWTTYVQRVLDRASNWAQLRVTTANYSSSNSGYAFDALVRAEVAYVSQVLWTRIVGFLNANATAVLQDDKRAQQWKQALANAASAKDDMTFWIGEAMRSFGLDVQSDIPGTGISTGVVETGMYPQTDTAALNYQGAQ